MPPFTLQKVAFYKPKDGLLQAKRPPLAKPLDVKAADIYNATRPK